MIYIYIHDFFIARNPLQIQAVAMDFVVEVLVSIPWNKILLLNSLSDVNHVGSLNLKHKPLCVCVCVCDIEISLYPIASIHGTGIYLHFP